jgi:hypothetical protein
MPDTVKTWTGQTFDVIEPEDRPRDPTMDGRNLRYAALEHDEMTMPQAIQVTDRDGRWAIYVPVEREPKMPPKDRPQDEGMDGRDMLFTPVEHSEDGVSPG